MDTLTWIRLVALLLGFCSALAQEWVPRSRSPNEYYFSNVTKTWVSARRYCVMQGGDLASVHSNEENQWIDAIRDKNKQYWIGLHNLNAKGEDDDNWLWSDNTIKDFVTWESHLISSNEPNDHGVACAHYDDDWDEDWLDDECSDVKRFICKRDIDDCADEPCQNGGSCTDLPSDFRCSCPSGFQGQFCATDIDECALNDNICLNNATCHNVEGSFECLCSAGFGGTYCGEDLDECISSPCRNGARCEDRVASYKCHCVKGFSGKTCEIITSGSSRKRGDNKSVLVAVLPVLTLLSLLVIFAVVLLIYIRRRKGASRSKSGAANTTTGRQENPVSEVVTIENELYLDQDGVYEHVTTPLNSPKRFEKGGVLYTQSAKNEAERENSDKYYTANHGAEPKVFLFQDGETRPQNSGSSECLVNNNDGSRKEPLYSEEQSTQKPRLPSENSLYSKQKPVPKPKPDFLRGINKSGSKEYLTQDTVIYDVIHSPPKKVKDKDNDPNTFPKARGKGLNDSILKPPLQMQSSLYAQEHYRTSHEQESPIGTLERNKHEVLSPQKRHDSEQSENNDGVNRASDSPEPEYINQASVAQKQPTAFLSPQHKPHMDLITDFDDNYALSSNDLLNTQQNGRDSCNDIYAMPSDLSTSDVNALEDEVEYTYASPDYRQNNIRTPLSSTTGSEYLAMGSLDRTLSTVSSPNEALYVNNNVSNV